MNQQTNEPGAPVHDEFSHGADVFRYMGVVADKLTNEGDGRIQMFDADNEPLCPVMGY